MMVLSQVVLAAGLPQVGGCDSYATALFAIQINCRLTLKGLLHDISRVCFDIVGKVQAWRRTAAPLILY
jgi:hypothetical protein